jgi:glutamine amidotransferase
VIVVIDYDAGNLMSIRNALARLGAEVKVSRRKIDIERSSALILPGVGAFECMKKIKPIQRTIINEIKQGKPFLGLCLGLQLLFESSEESPGVKGLGIFDGEVKKLPNKDGFKVPHLGWNSIKIARKCELLDGIPREAYVYFANSYVAKPSDRRIIAATSTYGTEFASVICKENIFATQFHPEKSGEVGLRMLRNFVELVS